jgi:hypothetical protein
MRAPQSACLRLPLTSEKAVARNWPVWAVKTSTVSASGPLISLDCLKSRRTQPDLYDRVLPIAAEAEDWRVMQPDAERAACGNQRSRPRCQTYKSIPMASVTVYSCRNEPLRVCQEGQKLASFTTLASYRRRFELVCSHVVSRCSFSEPSATGTSVMTSLSCAVRASGR